MHPLQNSPFPAYIRWWNQIQWTYGGILILNNILAPSVAICSGGIKRLSSANHLVFLMNFPLPLITNNHDMMPLSYTNHKSWSYLHIPFLQTNNDVNSIICYPHLLNLPAFQTIWEPNSSRDVSIWSITVILSNPRPTPSAPNCNSTLLFVGLLSLWPFSLTAKGSK